MGSEASDGFGDINIAFSTETAGAADRALVQSVEFLPDDGLGPLFLTFFAASEDPIVNAL